MLQDWIIRAILVDNQDDMCLNDCEGENENAASIKTAMIRIPRERPKNRQDAIEKMCHEKILVHELLHYVFLCAEESAKNRTYEGVQYDTVYHQNIERIAKALIMSKYNLSFDWFKNF